LTLAKADIGCLSVRFCRKDVALATASLLAASKWRAQVAVDDVQDKCRCKRDGPS